MKNIEYDTRSKKRKSDSFREALIKSKMKQAEVRIKFPKWALRTSNDD